MSNTPQIAVCVLTFRRKALLAQCLESLSTQRCPGVTYSIVVVDNDVEGSARAVVDARSAQQGPAIDYLIEPVQNIALARNRAVLSATADYIAFVDDDEVADEGWLARLLATCRAFSVDGVLGPVLPRFEAQPPAWLKRSGLCDRTRFVTGTRLENPRYMRTGNVLFRRHILTDCAQPFDPNLGRTGGEDADFFDRMLKQGRVFVWDDDAIVHEWVPKERQTLSYHVRRALVRGVTEADRRPAFSLDSAKSVAALGLYAPVLPLLAAVHRPLFARLAVSATDHLAKLLAHVGIRLAEKRSF